MIGEARAKELILLGRRLSAEEALAIGLVNRVTPPEKDVLDDTLEWIRPITEGAPIAQRAALGAIDAAARLPLEQGLKLEREAYDECLRSEDRREALLRFRRKAGSELPGPLAARTRTCSEQAIVQRHGPPRGPATPGNSREHALLFRS